MEGNNHMSFCAYCQSSTFHELREYGGQGYCSNNHLIDEYEQCPNPDCEKRNNTAFEEVAGKDLARSCLSCKWAWFNCILHSTKARMTDPKHKDCKASSSDTNVLRDAYKAANRLQVNAVLDGLKDALSTEFKPKLIKVNKQQRKDQKTLPAVNQTEAKADAVDELEKQMEFWAVSKPVPLVPSSHAQTMQSAQGVSIAMPWIFTSSQKQ